MQVYYIIPLIGCCACTVFTEMFTHRDRYLKFRAENWENFYS